MHRDSCILDDDNKSPFECQDIAAVAVQQLQRNPFLIPSRPLPYPFPTPSFPLARQTKPNEKCCSKCNQRCRRKEGRSSQQKGLPFSPLCCEGPAKCQAVQLPHVRGVCGVCESGNPGNRVTSRSIYIIHATHTHTLF